MAHARRPPLEGVGGALRRDPLPAARRTGLRSGAEGRRARGRPGRPSHRHRAPTSERRARVAKRLGVAADHVVDTLAATVGNTGAAHPALLLSRRARDGRARPGHRAGRARRRRRRGVAAHDRRDRSSYRRSAARRPGRGGAPVTYGKYLAWRKLLPVEPPRRPEPARPSSSAAGRAIDWKFGFVGSQRPATGVAAVAAVAERRPIRSRWPTCRARSSRSPSTASPTRESPPIIFAVVDFDGGGRLPIELTDVTRTDVATGVRVEMTFRKLFTSDDIHNYFWKGPTGPRSSLMGSHGIRDRVAIVSVGCTPFGEHWDRSVDDLMVRGGRRDASSRRRPRRSRTSTRTGSAPRNGVAASRWPSRSSSKASPSAGSRTTAPPARRRSAQASYAVASGAYDVAMAVGVEKLKDAGYQGVPATPATQRRHGPHAHRGGDVQHDRARLQQEVRRQRSRAARRAVARSRRRTTSTAPATRVRSSVAR